MSVFFWLLSDEVFWSSRKNIFYCHKHRPSRERRSSDSEDIRHHRNEPPSLKKSDRPVADRVAFSKCQWLELCVFFYVLFLEDKLVLCRVLLRELQNSKSPHTGQWSPGPELRNGPLATENPLSPACFSSDHFQKHAGNSSSLGFHLSKSILAFFRLSRTYCNVMATQ